MVPATRKTRTWKLSRASDRPLDGLVFQDVRLKGMLDLRFSFVTKDKGIPAPLAAASASEAVRKDTGIITWLDWPNLISIDGRTVGRAWVSGTNSVFTAGIQVNCFAALDSLEPEGRRPTSVGDVLGTEIDVDMLRDKTIHAFDWYLAEWERGMHQKMIDRIEPTIPWMGSMVGVVSDDGVVAGKATGLQEGCALVVDSGRGTVVFQPQAVKLVRPLP